MREERGLSMMALAKEIGVSDTAVCKWENQDSEPKLSYILKLAEFFNCSADYIIGRSDELGAFVQQNELSAEEKQLLSSFRTLDAQMRNLVTQTVRMIKNK